MPAENIQLGVINTVVGIQRAFAEGAFDILTGDVERLGGRLTSVALAQPSAEFPDRKEPAAC